MPTPKPISVQLYTLRAEAQKDFPAVLKTVADIGYKGVEFAGLHGHSATEIKALIDDLGLVTSSSHTALPAPENISQLVDTEGTLGNTRLNLNIALSYGARDEIAAAARAAAQAVADGTLDPASITAERFERFLSTAGMPDPDLMIRTSGEHRLSNFLLWQAAYAELVFLDVLWPDFDQAEFNGALAEFARRERRFGARPA